MYGPKNNLLFVGQSKRFDYLIAYSFETALLNRNLYGIFKDQGLKQVDEQINYVTNLPTTSLMEIFGGEDRMMALRAHFDYLMPLKSRGLGIVLLSSLPQHVVDILIDRMSAIEYEYFDAIRGDINANRTRKIIRAIVESFGITQSKNIIVVDKVSSDPSGCGIGQTYDWLFDVDQYSLGLGISENEMIKLGKQAVDLSNGANNARAITLPKFEHREDSFDEKKNDDNIEKDSMIKPLVQMNNDENIQKDSMIKPLLQINNDENTMNQLDYQSLQTQLKQLNDQLQQLSIKQIQLNDMAVNQCKHCHRVFQNEQLVVLHEKHCGRAMRQNQQNQIANNLKEQQQRISHMMQDLNAQIQQFEEQKKIRRKQQEEADKMVLLQIERNQEREARKIEEQRVSQIKQDAILAETMMFEYSSSSSSSSSSDGNDHDDDLKHQNDEGVQYALGPFPCRYVNEFKVKIDSLRVDNECSICQLAFVTKDRVKQKAEGHRRREFKHHAAYILAGCGHIFGESCLEKYAYSFKSKYPTCPYCREKFTIEN